MVYRWIQGNDCEQIMLKEGREEGTPLYGFR